ncbi:UDP-N-acetylmuramate--L-alanine ligase [Cetobacterium sp. SF1]|uniref:UDP-N-acetylmuramate--L-alanine ligase n=1 Tax=unclassified Cetobacterium TaxID=2630983 RepID=UPI003CF3667A
MKKIYFIGINGIGMSGLAKIMASKGYSVSGGDPTRNYVTEELEKLGIVVHNGHKAENVEGMDLVVASSAIKAGNPELQRAQELGIKIIKRGELLALLMNKEKGIAVAGTHGKTTTSSMLSSVLLGMDPTIVVGGILPEIKSNAQGGTSDIFVAEADESDNSFLYLTPYWSIITNIEADHLENHGSLENIKKSFKQFMDQTKKEILVCIDSENVREVIKGRKNILTYSLKDTSADIFCKNIKINEGHTSFDVYFKDNFLGTYTLSIPGEHNIQNALPVIYLAREFNVPVEDIQVALLKFKGAKRRYDILYDNDIKIIDDYAHHPTEIKATIQGAETIENRKIVAIFQPHRYSRVKFLMNEFEGAFDKVDEVILLPIYSAGEKNDFNVTLEDLGKKIHHKNLKIIKEENELENRVLKEDCKRVFLFMGAGNISTMAHDIVKKLQERKEMNENFKVV